MQKNTKKYKRELAAAKRISELLPLRNIYRVNFADMKHKWMYRARRAIKNGADSMQSGREI